MKLFRGKKRKDDEEQSYVSPYGNNGPPQGAPSFGPPQGGAPSFGPPQGGAAFDSFAAGPPPMASQGPPPRTPQRNRPQSESSYESDSGSDSYYSNDESYRGPPAQQSYVDNGPPPPARAPLNRGAESAMMTEYYSDEETNYQGQQGGEDESYYDSEEESYDSEDYSGSEYTYDSEEDSQYTYGSDDDSEYTYEDDATYYTEQSGGPPPPGLGMGGMGINPAELKAAMGGMNHVSAKKGPKMGRDPALGITSTRLGDLRAGMNHVSIDPVTMKQTKPKNQTKRPDWMDKVNTDRSGMGNLEGKGKNSRGGGALEWQNLKLKKGARPMTTMFNAPPSTAGRTVADHKGNGNRSVRKSRNPHSVRKSRNPHSVRKSRNPHSVRKSKNVNGRRSKNINRKSRNPQDQKPKKKPEFVGMKLKKGPRPMTTMFNAPPSRQAGSAGTQSNVKSSRSKAPGHGGSSGTGDGCYLMFDSREGGILYAYWSQAGVKSSDALGYFKPSSPVPRFKYKQNDGRIDILKGISTDKKKYFEAWTYFWLLAREVNGTVSILDQTKRNGFETDLWALDYSGKIVSVQRGKQIKTSKLDLIAVLPKASGAFQGLEKAASDSFISTAKKTGVCMKLE